VAAALARLAAPRPGESVLDPFCGDGTIVIETELAYPEAQASGADLDPARLENAARNAARAGVSVRLRGADVAAPTTPADAVVTNPPWNLAVEGAGSLRAGIGPWWRRLPDLLAPGGRLVAVTDTGVQAPSALANAGFGLGMAARVRLAGRVSDLVLAVPGRAPELDGSLQEWRERAVAAGVVTAESF
jgi:tRNA G10  N-methylase Trm11